MKNVILSDNETKLLSEVERLKQYVLDYGKSVNGQLDELEKSLLYLEEENSRLISAKRVVYVERDFCISLAIRLAILSGMKAGVLPGNIVVVDLPSGQVSWEFHESEAHLFAQFPSYPDPIEEMTIQEKYARVMNSGIITP